MKRNWKMLFKVGGWGRESNQLKTDLALPSKTLKYLL